jgi:predicted PurR-regulated permease PerM
MTDPQSRLTFQLDLPSLLRAVALISALWLVVVLQQVVLDILLAGLAAAALGPIVRWLEVRRLPKRFGILAIYLLLLGILGGTGFLLTSALLEQASHLLTGLPTYLHNITVFLAQLPYGDLFSGVLRKGALSLEPTVLHLFGSSLSYLLNSFQVLAHLLVILILVFFLLLDTEYFERSLLALFPPTRRAGLRQFLDGLSLKVGAYVRGTLIVLAACGLLTWLGLALLGVPYAFLIGFATFLLDWVPIIGAMVALGFAVLLTLGAHPTLVPGVIVVFLLTHQLKNYYLAPKILGHSVGLHPVWIFLAILAGGMVLGPVGIILATPFAIMVQSLLHTFYLNNESPSGGAVASA